MVVLCIQPLQVRGRASAYHAVPSLFSSSSTLIARIRVTNSGRSPRASIMLNSPSAKPRVSRCFMLVSIIESGTLISSSLFIHSPRISRTSSQFIIGAIRRGLRPLNIARNMVLTALLVQVMASLRFPHLPCQVHSPSHTSSTQPQATRSSHPPAHSCHR